MRIITKSRDHFHGTHKGCTISIDRERDPSVPPFYIIVTAPDGGYLYEGWAPRGVLTMADAKREALYGACLKERPKASQSGGEPREGGSISRRAATNSPTITIPPGGKP